MITSGERTLKYGQHDFEVSEALMTCPIHQYNSQSGAGLSYYILNHILRSARFCIRLIKGSNQDCTPKRSKGDPFLKD